MLRLSRKGEAEFVGAFEHLFGRAGEAGGYVYGRGIGSSQAAEFLLLRGGPWMR